MAELNDVARALRAGEPTTDQAFDAWLPAELQAVSRQYWTPLHVAVQAARWLRQLGVRSALDIGSGAGKFCIVSHLAGAFRCTGLEQRPRLVGAARDLALRFGVEEHVTFIQGALGNVATPDADALYMYNPFGENLYGPGEQLDADVDLGLSRYRRDLDAIDEVLTRARVGTYLLTYNGFGGSVPPSYRSIRSHRITHDVLDLWQKLDASERHA